jgi:hypothetical protein
MGRCGWLAWDSSAHWLCRMWHAPLSHRLHSPLRLSRPIKRLCHPCRDPPSPPSSCTEQNWGSRTSRSVRWSSGISSGKGRTLPFERSWKIGAQKGRRGHRVPAALPMAVPLRGWGAACTAVACAVAGWVADLLRRDRVARRRPIGRRRWKIAWMRTTRRRISTRRASSPKPRRRGRARSLPTIGSSSTSGERTRAAGRRRPNNGRRARVGAERAALR